MDQGMDFRSVISFTRKNKEIAIWLKCEEPSNRILISDIVDVSVHPKTENLREIEENIPKIGISTEIADE